MRDKLTDAIRVGVVSSINPDKGTAQVTFEDRDGIVTRDLPLNFAKTLEDYYYCMPDIGERVRCFFDPEAPSRGCILGSFPSDTREPPIKNKDKTYVLFKDETLVEYDREEHTLTIEIPEAGEKSIDVFAESDIDIETNGEMNIEVLEDINTTSKQNINIEALEDISIETSQNLNVEATEDISVTASQDIEIEADNIVITGKTSITLVVGGTKIKITDSGIVIEGNITQDGVHSDNVGGHCTC